MLSNDPSETANFKIEEESTAVENQLDIVGTTTPVHVEKNPSLAEIEENTDFEFGFLTIPDLPTEEDALASLIQTEISNQECENNLQPPAIEIANKEPTVSAYGMSRNNRKDFSLLANHQRADQHDIWFSVDPNKYKRNRKLSSFFSNHHPTNLEGVTKHRKPPQKKK